MLTKRNLVFYYTGALFRGISSGVKTFAALHILSAVASLHVVSALLVFIGLGLVTAISPSILLLGTLAIGLIAIAVQFNHSVGTINNIVQLDNDIDKLAKNNQDLRSAIVKLTGQNTLARTNSNSAIKSSLSLPNKLWDNLSKTFHLVKSATTRTFNLSYLFGGFWSAKNSLSTITKGIMLGGCLVVGSVAIASSLASDYYFEPAMRTCVSEKESEIDRLERDNESLRISLQDKTNNDRLRLRNEAVTSRLIKSNTALFKKMVPDVSTHKSSVIDALAVSLSHSVFQKNPGDISPQSESNIAALDLESSANKVTYQLS